MKKKILLSLTAATFLALSATACGTSASSGTRNSETTVLSDSQEESSVGIVTADGQSTITSSAAITPDVPSPADGQTSADTGSSEITEEQAKQVAFNNAQVEESELTGLTVKKDFDDGISIYEIEFQAGNKKYEYDIKAADGQIMKTDYEIDEDYVDPQTAQTSISESDARTSALAKVPGAADSDIRIKLEKDDGRLIYEGKIVYNNTEYDFEIDANTGNFLKWEQESVYD